MPDTFHRAFRGLTRILVVAITSAGLIACSGSDAFDDHGDNNGGNNNGGNNGGGSNDETPTAQLSPVGEIGMKQPLTVTFSESMNPDTLQLGGSMGPVAETEWSNGDSDNDTLTLTPANAWQSGAQTLVIDADDADGTALGSVEVDYNVRLVVDDFAEAAVVIGQQNFSGGGVNQGGSANANTLNNPTGTTGFAVEETTLFVPDTGSARVLAFNDIPSENNANADFVIGQPDFTSTAGDTSLSSMRSPQTITATNGKLVITDTQSHRVLIHDGIPSSGPVDPAVVVGQDDFNSRDVACDATSFNTPEAHFVTPDGKLIVADSAHNRVLIWNELPTANGQEPDLVLGQNDFTHCVANDDDQDAIPSPNWPPHAYTMSYPTGVWSDGEKLLVADSGNHRVLIWDEFPTENFEPADRLLGQNSFRGMAANDDDQDGATDADGTASQHVLNFPFGVWSDGSQIFVADRDNNRVVIWNQYPDHYFTPADHVIGQENFQNNAANDADQDGADDGTPTRTTLNAPTGVRVVNDRLVVSDTGNSRVLLYESE